MSSPLTDDQLRTRALGVLARHLGPVEAMRFLSLVRNQPRDYQRWREEQFRDLTTGALMEQMKVAEQCSREPRRRENDP